MSSASPTMTGSARLAISARVRSSPRDGLRTTTVPPASSTPSSAATCGGLLRSMMPTRVPAASAPTRRAGVAS